MQLEFVPVEEFYFALTLSVKTLDEIANPELLEQVRSRLSEKFGQPSTIAPSRQNFNYVFRASNPDHDRLSCAGSIGCFDFRLAG